MLLLRGGALVVLFDNVPTRNAAPRMIATFTRTSRSAILLLLNRCGRVGPAVSSSSWDRTNGARSRSRSAAAGVPCGTLPVRLVSKWWIEPYEEEEEDCGAAMTVGVLMQHPFFQRAAGFLFRKQTLRRSTVSVACAIYMYYDTIHKQKRERERELLVSLEVCLCWYLAVCFHRRRQLNDEQKLHYSSLLVMCTFTKFSSIHVELHRKNLNDL